MKDIIEQIIEIDSLAFEKKKKNEELLKNKRQEYENKIIKNRQSKLENAKLECEKIASLASIKDFNEFTEEKSNINTRIQTKYEEIEKEMVKAIFNKLFAVEN